MITFTKEQLIASAHARIEFAEMMLAGELEPLKERTWSIELELARIALASLEAEPVCVIDQSNLDYLNSGSDADVWPASRTEMGDVLLYRTTPPAPVPVPDEIRLLQSEVTIWKDRWELLRELFREIADKLWCDVKDHEAMLDKIEMLQGAERVTTDYKLPANTPCKEAPEHIWLQTAGVWPENGEFSELTWCSDNQHKDDTLYVRADVVSGNSPAIPDGWVLVPVEPTPEMINSAMLDNETGEVAEIYELMLAAAPQQEVVQALAKGMERYGDAMQELAKKEVK
ncbi:TPA: hypothetical protein ACK0K3_001404 [Enterobacter hormaechei]